MWFLKTSLKLPAQKYTAPNACFIKTGSKKQPPQLPGMDLTNPKKKHGQYADRLQWEQNLSQQCIHALNDSFY